VESRTLVGREFVSWLVTPTRSAYITVSESVENVDTNECIINEVV